MRFVLIFVLSCSLCGCFWTSPPPDLNDKDRVTKLVVIWNQIDSDNRLHRLAWSTTQASEIRAHVQLLTTTSWTSTSVLPAGHSTRIILTMRSGKVWEILPSNGSKKLLKMFDRNDRGSSGWIHWSDPFIAKLQSTLNTQTGASVDLVSEYHDAIKRGEIEQVISDAAYVQLKNYPGYPEINWNETTKEFEYAK